MLTGLASLGLSAQSPSPICGTQVYHFENTAEVASSVYMSIGYDSPNTIFVEVESATADAVDLILVNSTTPGWAPGAVDSSVAGKYRTTIGWNTAVSNVDINVLWSKRGMPGNWQWIAGAGTYNVTVADTCGGGGSAPAPTVGGDVTFSVDMSNYSGSFTGVYVNGDFTGWCGACAPMTDMGNGIWELTTNIAQDSIDYKFTVDGWTDQENLTAGMSCVKTKGGFTNRYLRILGDTAVGTVCWDDCAACPAGPPASAGDIQFNVDMSNYGAPYSNVYVSGTFNGWCGDCNQLTDIDGDGVYTGTVAAIGPGAIEYKFTLDNWAGQENLIAGSSCTVTNGGFTNRSMTIDGDSTLSTVCWESCTDCNSTPAVRNVTFSVDMSNYGGSTANGVYVNGTFNGWCGACNPMTDMGNGVWEVTLPLTSGTIEYKYTVDGWNDQENFSGGESCTVTNGGFTNRELTFSSDTSLATVCWNTCAPCNAITSKNVTFSVDMTDYTGSTANGVYVNGDFNGWCGTCAPMTDMGNGIWELTAPVTADSIEYKFTVDGWNDQEQFAGGESCTKTTGAFTNRFALLQGDTSFATVCFNSCGACTGTPTSANVTFQVDMRGYTGTWTDVNLNGTFNGWCGGCAIMTDANNDSIYELTVNVSTAVGIEWKYTVDGWTDSETLDTALSCVLTTNGFTNRYLMPTADTTLDAVCWETCDPCNSTPPATSHNITLSVNMNAECDYDSVDVAGDFNSWSSMGHSMMDMGNGIYTATVSMAAGSNDYKFRKWVNGMAVMESISNRNITVTGDATHPAVCFNNVASCDGITVDSVATVNLAQGVYRVHWSSLPAGASSFFVEWNEEGGSGSARTKGANNVNITSQKINITPWFNANVEYRLGVKIGSDTVYSCMQTLAVPCKPMTIQTAEQNAATCLGDSALLRVGYAGGRGAKTILWSNGSTVKRTYADQGETLTVTVTDDRGCQESASITASVLAGTAEAPSNVSTTRSGAIVTVNWSAATLGAGESLIGYRVNYRLRNSGNAWSTTTLTTNTSMQVDMTNEPTGNYEFSVATRYNNGTSNVTSALACRTVRGWPGIASKSDFAAGAGVSIYPNPATTELNVEAAAGSNVDLLDINGRVIATQEVEGNSVRFNMADLASGVYMVRVQTGDALVTERVVKQ